MDPSSVMSRGFYTVFGAVIKKKHPRYTKPVSIRTISYRNSLQAAIITLSKPYKGAVQVTVNSGIMAANGASLGSSSVMPLP
jgi:hypothetical protein